MDPTQNKVYQMYANTWRDEVTNIYLSWVCAGRPHDLRLQEPN